MWIAVGSKRINLDHVSMVDLDHRKGDGTVAVALALPAHTSRQREGGEVPPYVVVEGAEAEAVRTLFTAELWPDPNFDGPHCLRLT